MAVSKELWSFVEEQFPMGEHSFHGPSHWRRVLKFGKRIARTNGADLELLELFALFHDSRRVNDSIDHNHGKRGADLALKCHGTYFNLDQDRLDLLLLACREHTTGGKHKEPTIAACWDSDRLDLWRVGIYPDPDFMCTKEARSREMIEWAVSYSALA